MAAQFPSICYVKGVYAAQSNLRLNSEKISLVLAGLRVQKSTDSHVVICCGHGVAQWPVSVDAAFQTFPRLSLEAAKPARHSK